MDEPPSKSTDASKSVAYGVYAVALMAASTATFGPVGITIGGVILAAWGYIFLHPRREAAFGHVVMLAAIGVMLLLLLPAVQSAREASRRTQCNNFMKQLGLALHNYHDAYGSFPPAYTVDADGRPLHSWRVLILPYLDYVALYNEFHLDEPWNSPHNLNVAKTIPVVYACPSREIESGHFKDSTSYVVVVDDGTVWPGNGYTRRLRDIKDGSSNTILVIESNSGIPWNEPRDLSLDEALGQLADTEPMHARGHHAQSFFYKYSSGRQVLFADGSVRFVDHGIDRDTWLQALLMGDGRPLAPDWDDAKTEVDGTKVPRISNWIRLGMFLIVALFPLPWVWLNPTSGRGDRAVSRGAGDESAPSG